MSIANSACKVTGVTSFDSIDIVCFIVVKKISLSSMYKQLIYIYIFHTVNPAELVKNWNRNSKPFWCAESIAVTKLFYGVSLMCWSVTVLEIIGYDLYVTICKFDIVSPVVSTSIPWALSYMRWRLLGNRLIFNCTWNPSLADYVADVPAPDFTLHFGLSFCGSV
jgi:hypothetical protein